MKKFKNVPLTVLIAILVFIPCFVSAINKEQINEGMSKNEIEKNSYQYEISVEVEKILHISSEEYPSYFGGMYISDDSSNLVIQIVKEQIPKVQKGLSDKDVKELDIYNKLSKLNQNIIFEYVDNSYNELEKINSEIIDFFSNINYDYKNPISNYIDIFNNSVVVELENNNLYEQERFKKEVVDSSLILFKDRESIDDSTELKAGSSLGNCTLGYRAKVNGVYGYITAGHCTDGLNSTLPTGQVTKYQYSGSVDAAFVRTLKGISVSNLLDYNLAVELSTIDALNLTVNTVIGKDGRTTGYTTGKIKNASYSTTINNVYFTDLVLTDATCAGGDSGGPVFTLTNPKVSLAGIVKAQTNGKMIFTKVSNIHKAFNAIRY